LVELEPKTASADQAAHEPLLRVTGLTVQFGGLRAVDGFSFGVQPGTITGLIGPNGAGKTTTIDAVAGYNRYRGSIVFGGRPLDGLRPHKRQRAGLSRTFQSLELFDDLTVRENVGLSSMSSLGRAVVEALTFRPATEPALVGELLDQFGLTKHADATVTGLSQGERKLVSIARSLASRPDLVLLDEPAAGLDSTESAWLGTKLLEVRDRGITMLLVDHDMSLVLSVCDYIYVLDFGRLVAEGSPDEVKANPAVIAAYLGDTHTALEEPGVP
jgi:ABC-type branched-subunit amino acid transport system ATPase component